ncbi:hypothetical protein E2C01_071371 [Portunus trituberculatus]|uniref:Uncharacterized protein n=1 Tax=Portunus trituberculatus TaxID=210409 RepID=A0A5B7I818_PORTR|nr:hypothetical protein [Portunus trituberculatus]
MAKAARELEKRQSGHKTATAWTQQMSQQILSNVSSPPPAHTPPRPTQGSAGGPLSSASTPGQMSAVATQGTNGLFLLPLVMLPILL